jgi:DNA-binding winged helix-turn-helix (wHTH) protein
MGASREKLQVGDWLIDPTTDEFRRGDLVARVEPKAVDVLLVLAARPGEVVSRERPADSRRACRA